MDEFETAESLENERTALCSELKMRDNGVVIKAKNGEDLLPQMPGDCGTEANDRRLQRPMACPLPGKWSKYTCVCRGETTSQITAIK